MNMKMISATRRILLDREVEEEPLDAKAATPGISRGLALAVSVRFFNVCMLLVLVKCLILFCLILFY